MNIIENVDDIVYLASKLSVDQEEDWADKEVENIEIGEKALVGCVITKKKCNIKFLKTVLERIWKLDFLWDVKLLRKEKDKIIVALTFERKQDAIWVTEKMPWTFGGGFLLTEKWSSTGNWEDAIFKGVPCWVKMLGFPSNVFSENNIRRMGVLAGEILDVKWKDNNQSFLKRVGIARILYPLDKSIFVGKYIPVEGKKYWVQFKFDKLSFLCYKCGIWGHDWKTCESEWVKVESLDGKVVNKYGMWLKGDSKFENCFDQRGFSEEYMEEVTEKESNNAVILQKVNELGRTDNFQAVQEEDDLVTKVVAPQGSNAGKKFHETCSQSQFQGAPGVKVSNMKANSSDIYDGHVEDVIFNQSGFESFQNHNSGTRKMTIYPTEGKGSTEKVDGAYRRKISIKKKPRNKSMRSESEGISKSTGDVFSQKNEAYDVVWRILLTIAELSFLFQQITLLPFHIQLQKRRDLHSKPAESHESLKLECPGC
ncbi:hypothetical protein POM88_046195 [Heracleum sosnowskyi]|uniref:CCHC-type domain-containing protein n=1 Tax=Heracleum sosnowskyi TaxID=360622 RepID=A0AAD8H8F7_9APIA|nr:hypothetical protein POM88_046195 [Heracleum sosnowskyi]